FADAPMALARLAGMIVQNLLAVGVWVAVCAAIFSLTRSRTTFGARDVLRAVAVAIAIAVAVELFQGLLGCHLYPEGCPPIDERRKIAFLSLPNTIAITVNVFAVGWAVRSMTLSQEHRIRTGIAQSELFRSQTLALERQLRPHFLFNTLQSAATLMHRDAEGARGMLLGLRSLLQHSIESSAVAEIPLAEEMEIIGLYLGIETWRFSSRLEVRHDLQPEALRAGIPPFLLQPLIENAVHHAVAIRGGGRIEIRARVSPGARRLEITVSDTGAGSAGRGARGASTGIGLQNARTRLQILYGKEWDLAFRLLPEGGSAVDVSLPFRPMNPALPRVG
ncbi:MAG TPA: histidine kinase, partial [Longimicrobium sp.]|nr:histidine kinase [Longimicrobium sp.]